MSLFFYEINYVNKNWLWGFVIDEILYYWKIVYICCFLKNKVKLKNKINYNNIKKIFWMKIWNNNYCMYIIRLSICICK